MTKLEELKHPILVLVRGLPGSGKSYFAHELQKSIDKMLGPDTVVMLDPDSIDLEGEDYKELSKDLTQQGVEEKFHPYRFSRGRAHKGIETNKIIVWNQPFTNFDGFNKTVINLTAHAKEHHKNMPILVIEVEIDHDTAKQRVDQRKSEGGHGPSDNTFDRFKNDYVSFADKGLNTLTIHGENDVSKSVESALQAIAKLQ